MSTSYSGCHTDVVCATQQGVVHMCFCCSFPPFVLPLPAPHAARLVTATATHHRNMILRQVSDSSGCR